MTISVVTLFGDDESSEADIENTTNPDSSPSAVTPSTESDSGEVDDESAMCTVSGMETEVEDEDADHTVGQAETETETDDESTTSVIHKTLTEQTLKDQTEETKLNLLQVPTDPNMDDGARSFALTLAKIVEWWQYYAQDDVPTSLQINFGVGAPMTLLMVFALLPEKYQGFIGVDDENRSPLGNEEGLSWLHEQTMDVLVGLSMDPTPASHLFGRSLASMMRDEVDAAWRVFTGQSWLEDQFRLLSEGSLEPDLYLFPPGTERIVLFFNPTEVHWTVVEVDLNDEIWTYTLYNSLFQGERGPTWNACQHQFPLLEQLICRASKFPEPKTRKIIAATSAQQKNAYDCGVVALYNAMELLEGRSPTSEIDAESLRLKYLTFILDALPLLDGGIELPEFRARTRKIWLDYSM